MKNISWSLPNPELGPSSMKALYCQFTIAVTFLASVEEIPESYSFFENSPLRLAAIASQNINTSAAFAYGDSSAQRDHAMGSTMTMYTEMLDRNFP